MIRKVAIFITLFGVLNSCHSENKTGIQGDNNDRNSVTIGNNNVIITDGKNRIADSVEIQGLWDKEKASHLVLTLLNESLDSIKDEYSHEIIDFYNMDYVDKQTNICVTFSRPKRKLDEYGDDTAYSCHACGGQLSFFEFDKYSNGWKLEHKYIRSLNWGQWGEAGADKWKLMNIGYHKFGFVVEDGGMGQGYTETSVWIYAIIGDEFKEIFNVATGFDDSGAKEISEDSYDSKIDVLKEGTGFYDLVITTSGIKDKKNFNEINYYKYDGKNYSLSNKFK